MFCSYSNDGVAGCAIPSPTGEGLLLISQLGYPCLPQKIARQSSLSLKRKSHRQPPINSASVSMSGH